jgi:hypothetical protein
MRQILLARVEPDEGAPFLRDVIANGSAQDGMARLERVEDRAERRSTLDLERDLAVHARERPQVCGQFDADHASVCTSTDNTAGRSRTIGDHVSPASGDAYTCPPVVPK